jgi:hypothetical protein
VGRRGFHNFSFKTSLLVGINVYDIVVYISCLAPLKVTLPINIKPAFSGPKRFLFILLPSFLPSFLGKGGSSCDNQYLPGMLADSHQSQRYSSSTLAAATAATSTTTSPDAASRQDKNKAFLGREKWSGTAFVMKERPAVIIARDREN